MYMERVLATEVKRSKFFYIMSQVLGFQGYSYDKTKIKVVAEGGSKPGTYPPLANYYPVLLLDHPSSQCSSEPSIIAAGLSSLLLSMPAVFVCM